MYRGQPFVHPHDCKPCNGTGKILDETRTRVTHDCTSCNGTGMAGDPRFVLIGLIVWVVFLCGVVGYCALHNGG